MSFFFTSLPEVGETCPREVFQGARGRRIPGSPTVTVPPPDRRLVSRGGPIGSCHLLNPG